MHDSYTTGVNLASSAYFVNDPSSFERDWYQNGKSTNLDYNVLYRNYYGSYANNKTDLDSFIRRYNNGYYNRSQMEQMKTGNINLGKPKETDNETILKSNKKLLLLK